jgi:hypothetical protein
MRPSQLFCAVMILGVATSARGVVLFSDNFESYASGTGDTTPLGKNSAGPNADTNGSGNPWWGPFPPNLRVVTSGDGGVTAHSGNQMVRGLSTGGDFDQEYYNLAYRLNSGSAFAGSLRVDWWFYDPLGAGNNNYQDYGALGYYSNVPSDTDYPIDSGSGVLTGINQRLSLGAANTPGNDTTKYQARVVGATDGTINANGWYNTNRDRSIGWHEARIVLGDAAGTDTQVSFYIDDMANPVLVHSITSPSGINVLELNGAFGPQPGYYDDISISSVAPLAGDYNNNGVVDAADYIMWRKTDGTPAGYNLWRSHFGQSTFTGAATSSARLAPAGVPEPTSALLLVLGAAACFIRSGR